MMTKIGKTVSEENLEICLGTEKNVVRIVRTLGKQISSGPGARLHK